ncbi:hypothetical protein FN846DRAFT_931322 [Sphaerosporella brunnea]|uniref:Uncharacterized protein n=1 Tax=Sphaerosporella brunnea TaxID=1250544 RepID=A0A5J5F7P7_9PEZI|nr:hypothetical protein FN846DRAFT_931322 [Sphaerosporella brunnea]
MSIAKPLSWLRRGCSSSLSSSDSSSTPQKTTYTLPPTTTSPPDTLLSCTTSSFLPSYHIPSTLATTLMTLTISAATPTNASSLPRYREAFKLSRLPFVGFQHVSARTRAQIRVSGTSKKKANVYLLTPLRGFRSGEDRPALKLKKASIEDAATGKVLARCFSYKTGDDGEMRALELTGGLGDNARLRELLIGVWICQVWNDNLETKAWLVGGKSLGTF